MHKYPKYMEPWFTYLKCEDCDHVGRETDMKMKLRINQINKRCEKDLVCPKCGSYNLIQVKGK